MTQEALKASIEKWERNAVAEKPEDFLIGAKNCPLCDLYNSHAPPCIGCAVYEHTKWSNCIHTPYRKAVSCYWDWESIPSNDEYKRAAHEAARREVAFLRGLLK